MIIWRNEYAVVTGVRDVMAEPPPGPVEITRVEERDGNYHIWFAPVPAKPA